MSAFVVTGTDTGIGKTVFSAALAGAIGAHYWKPIQSGLLDGADRDTVEQLSGLPASHILPEAYRLTEPLSPHRAAELDGVEIDPDRLILPQVRPLVVEGAGGALVPVTREVTYADVFAKWGLLTIIVARTGLGTINHTLMTIEALRVRRVPIHGVAFVGEANEDNEATIAAMGQVRRLGRLPVLPELTAPALAAAFAEQFRIEDFT
ncbi:MAG: dethiobiotin synthase [Novosphingobium sp.]